MLTTNDCPSLVGHGRADGLRCSGWLRTAGHDQARREVLADAHGRRNQMVCSLITIMRCEAPSDREETIPYRALHVLDAGHVGFQVLGDLLQVIRHAPQQVHDVSLDRGGMTSYQQITEPLETTLLGLCGGGRLGDLFSQPTTVPMRRDRSVVFDLSSIDDAQMDLQVPGQKDIRALRPTHRTSPIGGSRLKHTPILSLRTTSRWTTVLITLRWTIVQIKLKVTR